MSSQSNEISEGRRMNVQMLSESKRHDRITRAGECNVSVQTRTTCLYKAIFGATMRHKHRSQCKASAALPCEILYHLAHQLMATFPR